MPLHRILLRGPWNYGWLSAGPGTHGSTGAPESGVLKMPIAWQDAFGVRSGAVRFERRFQWPTTLEQGEQVLLVFEGIGGEAVVLLNDERLGTVANGPARFDITRKLRSTNRLSVEVRFDPVADAARSGGLWAPVALEIHEAGNADSRAED